MKSSQDTPRRVLVVGMDGASLDVINALTSQGELPVLSKIMEEGTSGVLTSVIPPLSPPAWSTFLTGKNPGKHGVFHFLRRPYETNDGSRSDFYNRHSLKAPSIPEILQQSNIQIGMVNVCPTYPPFPLNGFIISGMDTPSETVEYSYPPELKREMAEQGIPYQIDYNKKSKLIDFFLGGERKMVNEYLSIELKRAVAASYLMATKSWDLFTVVFNLPDRIQHMAWHYWALGNFASHHPGSFMFDVVPKAYRFVDELVGKLLSELKENTNIILISDHGFCSTEKVLFLNKWLCDNGFLRLRKIPLPDRLRSIGLSKVSKPLDAWLVNLKLGFLRALLPDKLLRKRIRVVFPKKKNLLSIVDWKNTVAYAGGGYGIYINLKGRTANGIIEPGAEYEELRERIASCLSELEDPDTGERVISKILRKEEIYRGEHLFYAPDLLIETKDYQYVINDGFNFQMLFEPYYSGAHHPDGFLAMVGPSIKRKHRIPFANLVDITPTILYLLDQSIPEDMDGRVLAECFEEGLHKKNPA